MLCELTCSHCNQLESQTKYVKQWCPDSRKQEVQDSVYWNNWDEPYYSLSFLPGASSSQFSSDRKLRDIWSPQKGGPTLREYEKLGNIEKSIWENGTTGRKRPLESCRKEFLESLDTCLSIHKWEVQGGGRTTRKQWSQQFLKIKYGWVESMFLSSRVQRHSNKQVIK